jgi:DnaK suppressor protein
MTDDRIEEFRRKLVAMKQDLVAQSQSTEDARKPVALDQQSVGRLSRMDALQEQAMQLETERRRKTALLRIEAALSRMDEDEFGYCISCGEPIGERRLANDPSVASCVKCAQKA